MEQPLTVEIIVGGCYNIKKLGQIFSKACNDDFCLVVYLILKGKTFSLINIEKLLFQYLLKNIIQNNC